MFKFTGTIETETGPNDVRSFTLDDDLADTMIDYVNSDKLCALLHGKKMFGQMPNAAYQEVYDTEYTLRSQYRQELSGVLSQKYYSDMERTRTVEYVADELAA